MMGGRIRALQVLAVTAALSLSPVSSEAFNSYPAGAPHDQITRAACVTLGWSGRTASELCVAVRRADRSESRWAPGASPTSWLRFRTNASYRPEHHFDRPPRSSSAEAFTAGAAYVRSQADTARVAIREGRRAGALVALGRAAHAIQDLCSHSNLVDLPDSVGARIETAVWDPAAGVPGALRLTGYDPHARDPERPVDDDYSHGDWSKDSAGKNAEARARVGEQTKFARARELAVGLTVRLFQRLEREAPQGRWDSSR